MNHRGQILRTVFLGVFSAVLLGGLVTGEAAASWEKIGPSGGAIRALAGNPQQASELFAVTASRFGQVYKSSDSAKSWRVVAGFSGPLYDIGVDSGNAGVVYTLGASSIHKSEDGGLTWRTVPLPPDFSGCEGKLVVPPGRAGTVYAAGRNGQLAVAKSVDYGETWNLCCSGISTSEGYAVGADANPKNPENIYVFGHVNGRSLVYRTFDGGQSWTGAALSSAVIPADIVFDPFDSSKALLATHKGVYRTSDGGASWNLFSAISLYQLCADPTDPGTFYGGYENACYRSPDGGASWFGGYTPVLGTCSSLGLQAGTLFYGSNLGVAVSPAATWSWASSSSGINAREIIKVTVSPAMPNILFIVDKDGGFFKSTDFGDSWIATTDVFRGHWLTALTMSLGYVPYAYASSFTGVRCGAG